MMPGASSSVLVASLLLVAMPGAPSSVLVSSRVRPGAPSGVLQARSPY